MKRVFFVLMCVCLISAVGNAAIVSWNYNNWGDAYSNQATDISGLVPAAYWNDTWLDGRTTNLLDSTGAATTIDIGWSTYNSWHIRGYHMGPDIDGTHNREILNGYLNAGPAGWNPPQTYSNVTLSEIGYPSYDIIVYFSSDVAGREGYVTDGSTTYYFNTVGPASVPDPGNAVFSQATDTTENGYTVAANYAVFSGLSGASQTVTVQMRDIDEWGGIAAVQIVPEPCTLISLGTIGLVFMGFFFRRVLLRK